MPRTHHLAIDPARPLAQQPQTGHNRWHEDIPPALEVAPGDTVILETRDAFDGQLSPASTRDDVGALNLGPVHPLTGPVYIQGAQPGDLLEVKLLDVDPDPFGSWGYTVEVPGFGFLRDAFPEPFIAHWHLTGKRRLPNQVRVRPDQRDLLLGRRVIQHVTQGAVQMGDAVERSSAPRLRRDPRRALEQRSKGRHEVLLVQGIDLVDGHSG